MKEGVSRKRLAEREGSRGEGGGGGVLGLERPGEPIGAKSKNPLTKFKSIDIKNGFTLYLC